MTTYRQQRRNDLYRFWQSTQERFDSLSHFILMGLFLMAHYLLLKHLGLVQLPMLGIILSVFGVAIFFFNLRLYDEIKDYELDSKINPHRPLPRGLVTEYEVKKGIELCLLLTFILFAQSSLAAASAIILTQIYSLLMYHEFFIPQTLRPHLTTYATTHTVVTFFLSLAIFQAWSRLFLWQLPKDLFLFALTSWLLFNIFELGRKTYQPSEERMDVESYSKVWGRLGAVLLVLAHAFIACFPLILIPLFQTHFFYIYLASILTILIIIGLYYLMIPKESTGKVYRAFSSLYIVLIYLGMIINLLFEV